MLHLAQVQKNESSGEVELLLLACQQADSTWAVMNPEAVFPLAKSTDTPAGYPSSSEGLLVLVELSGTDRVLSIQDARDWVLDLVRQFLTGGLTPDFLKQEAERAEQWRQDLTLQSQELARRTMEMEARQEQIQALEEDLKRNKKQLELMAAQLKTKTEEQPDS